MKGSGEAQGMIIYYYSEPEGAGPLPAPGPFLLQVSYCIAGLLCNRPKRWMCVGRDMGPVGPRAEAWTLAVPGPRVRQDSSLLRVLSVQFRFHSIYDINDWGSAS